jgi:hypothetical protein
VTPNARSYSFARIIAIIVYLMALAAAFDGHFDYAGWAAASACFVWLWDRDRR